MHDAQDKPSNVDTARYELPLVFETQKESFLRNLLLRTRATLNTHLDVKHSETPAGGCQILMCDRGVRKHDANCRVCRYAAHIRSLGFSEDQIGV